MSGFVSGHSFSFTFYTTSAAGIPTAVAVAPTLKVWIDGWDTPCAYTMTHISGPEYRVTMLTPTCYPGNMVQVKGYWSVNGIARDGIDLLPPDFCIVGPSGGGAFPGPVTMIGTTSEIETVRTMIQIPSPQVTGQIWLSDDEINVAISMEPDLFCAAAMCLEILAADVAKAAKGQTNGPFSSNKDAVHRALLESAARWRERSENEGYSEDLEFSTYPWGPLNRRYGSVTPLDTGNTL